MAKVMKKFHFLFWTALNFLFIRFNFWKSSKEAELLVTSMTAGMEDITLLQLKYQPDSEWRQMNLSLPMDGWSNWFALQFTARLLLPTGSYQKTCSVAIDEIYFTNDCGMVTSSAPDTTTALPNTTTPLQPNVII